MTSGYDLGGLLFSNRATDLHVCQGHINGIKVILLINLLCTCTELATTVSLQSLVLHTNRPDVVLNANEQYFLLLHEKNFIQVDFLSI